MGKFTQLMGNFTQSLDVSCNDGRVNTLYGQTCKHNIWVDLHKTWVDLYNYYTFCAMIMQTLKCSKKDSYARIS